MSPASRRLAFVFVAPPVIVLAGSLAYDALGRGRWSFGDCMYMTVTTLSTVGFAELNNMSSVAGARLVTVVLILTGLGTIAYAQATVTALLVEGVIGQAYRRKRMRKTIEAMSGHIVVAGAGSTGRHSIEELVTTQTPLVVIDRDLAHLERINAELAGGKLLYVAGDATEDSVLLAAGVDRARGIVAALTHDKDNLYVTLSARSLNATGRIVTKVTDNAATAKMLRAGATTVVNPTMIGGRVMAGECIRPVVHQFMDQMLRDKDKNLRLEDVVIPAGSSLIGVALKDAPIRRETRALVIAVRQPSGEFLYNPEPDLCIGEGMALVVLGETDSIVKLRRLVEASVAASTG